MMHDRVVATPHLGGSTYEALERIAMELARDVVHVLGGRPAAGAVNAPTLTGADAERAGGFIDLAYRLGVLLPQMFDGVMRDELAIVLQGDLESLEAEPFVAALLAGALPFMTDRRVTLVNAHALARDIGVRVVVSRERESAPFRSQLVVAAAGHRLAGTVLPHGPRIVEVDGFEVDAVPQGAMLVTRHRDVPGMVGRIGTILGNANVNISTMQVARNARGGEAMMVLEVDRDVDRPVLDAIGTVDGISAARLVRV
jgi:D-3-phosphoglycerate dehydrogenase